MASLVLVAENQKRGRTWFSLLPQSKKFNLQFIHSIYGGWQREYWRVEEKDNSCSLFLYQVNFESYDAFVYYGVFDEKELPFDGKFYRLKRNHHQDKINFVLPHPTRSAFELLIGDITVRGNELGEPGDEILIYSRRIDEERFEKIRR
jgi:hypothetical protein